ncbi:MAG: phosphoserine phosphatase SerB [Pikeienuella sp.]
MHYLVITGGAPISDDVGAAAHLALSLVNISAEEPNRLAADAIEIAFRGDAVAALGAARAQFAGAALDCNTVPAANRRKRLLICDMDSTIIPVECIDEIADFAGVKPRVAEITERAMRGELDFEAALRERVGLLTGLSVDALQQTYDERITLNPGAAEMVSVMRGQGAFTALVSGGFTYFTEKVAADAGFEYNQANTLLVENGALTGVPGVPILGKQAKLDALNALCNQIGANADDAVAVGDGANDLAMINASGLGIAYRAKPTVAAEADARLDHSDLTAVLRLQGIPA